MVNFIWFTDEKLFTVAAPNNTQNDCVYAPAGVPKKQMAAGRLLRTRPTFSPSVMVSVGVSALGRTRIHFIDPGVKISGTYYRDVLLKPDLLLEIRQHSNYFTFQQDRAPAHRASETVQLLKQMTPDFIPPTLWPPNSPDLNPVDYAVWGIMQERVYKKKIKDVDELRQRIVEEWEQLGQHVIDNAIRQWRRRLQGCVDADGGQFEHSLWLTFSLPEWTSLSFLKCLTILCRLHYYMSSIVFASTDCSLQRIFVIYSTKSKISRICIL